MLYYAASSYITMLPIVQEGYFIFKKIMSWCNGIHGKYVVHTYVRNIFSEIY
jgi:hypothetical protein